jgi:hypothetical protein
MRNSGRTNGGLVCTYADFVNHGIWRSSVADAIRQANKLGFLEITQRGRRIAGVNRPSHYRLTYLPTDNAAPTDEWRFSKTK